MAGCEQARSSIADVSSLPLSANPRKLPSPSPWPQQDADLAEMAPARD